MKAGLIWKQLVMESLHRQLRGYDPPTTHKDLALCYRDYRFPASTMDIGLVHTPVLPAQPNQAAASDIHVA